jgi:putative cell wall-binding protein
MNIKMKKVAAGIAAAALAATIANPSVSTVKAADYENPSIKEINKLLTEAAIRNDVPPEVVKAIAEQESGWRQFKDGEPYTDESEDRPGYGIMQVTDTAGYDVERLKTDIVYNIEKGIGILNKKWELGEKGLTNWTSSSIPTVGDNDRDIIENWYFAILAYNGQVQENSPTLQKNGDINTGSYQYEVYQKLSEGNPGIFPTNTVNIPFSPEQFTYTGAPNYFLLFNKKNYEVEGLSHATKHLFEPGDLVVSAEGSRFREASTSESKEVSPKLPAGETEVLEILNGFEYDQSRYPNHFVWYDIEREDNKREAYVASSELNKIGQRLSGIDRMQTAVDISQQGWEKADTVVLAQGFSFPDALTGGPLAYKKDGPLLLTEKNRLTEATKNEIMRLGASNVIILGGKGAVGSEVESALKNMNLNVERIGGEDRFETAKKIAAKVNASPDKAIIAYGYKFPDALSVAPYAASKGYPILLTNTENVPGFTKEALKQVDSTIVVGGTAAISNKVMKDVNATQRISGIDRYETSLEIAKKLPLSNPERKALVASGTNYPDALSGAVLAAKEGAPLLLSKPDQLPGNIQDYILSEAYKEFYLLGGSSAIDVEDELGDLYKELYY